MHISIALAPAPDDATLGVHLVDPDDLTSLSVVVPADVPSTQLDDVLRVSGVGELDTDREHVHLRLDELRRRAAGRVDDDWAERFTGMVAYASGRGWVAADGSTVRAHVDRRPDATTHPDTD